MSRGWTKHPREHALAARGIPCRAGAVFRPYRPTGYIEYGNPEEVFKAFWKASIEDDWDEFDFKEAFGFLREELGVNLSSLGMLNDENMVGYIHIVHGPSITGYMKQNAPAIWRRYASKDMSEEEKERGMVRDLRLEEEKALYYADWVKVYRALEKGPGLPLQEKIFLMDAVIHLEHDRGSAFMDPVEGDFIDIDKLREEFDRVYGTD